jgi:hypothetical protein
MHSDFITFWGLENLHVALTAKHNHTSFDARSGNHYMPLQRLTLVHMSCFVIGFPLLGIVKPSGPFLNS